MKQQLRATSVTASVQKMNDGRKDCQDCFDVEQLDNGHGLRLFLIEQESRLSTLQDDVYKSALPLLKDKRPNQEDESASSSALLCSSTPQFRRSLPICTNSGVYI